MSGKYTPTEYGQRLKQAMKLAGLIDDDGRPRPGAFTKVGKALQISGAAVGMVLTGQTKQFAPDNSARAARFLNVDHFWLATGEGEPRPPGLSEQAIEWARRYDRLDEDGKAKFAAAIVLSRTGSRAEGPQQQAPAMERQPAGSNHDE